mmetsp:Transcript_27238/g.57622  ORF Transcript_27238/g.57622 Transcript_27238/m.57622 type:complete len:307 (+) Transcript_27238:924-1844(+)
MILHPTAVALLVALRITTSASRSLGLRLTTSRGLVPSASQGRVVARPVPVIAGGGSGPAAAFHVRTGTAASAIPACVSCTNGRARWSGGTDDGNWWRFGRRRRPRRGRGLRLLVGNEAGEAQRFLQSRLLLPGPLHVAARTVEVLLGGKLLGDVHCLGLRREELLLQLRCGALWRRRRLRGRRRLRRKAAPAAVLNAFRARTAYCSAGVPLLQLIREAPLAPVLLVATTGRARRAAVRKGRGALARPRATGAAPRAVVLLLLLHHLVDKALGVRTPPLVKLGPGVHTEDEQSLLSNRVQRHEHVGA